MSFFKRRILSFKYAFQGIRWAFATQPNLWIHLIAAIIVVILGSYFDIQKFEWIVLIGCITSVFTLEFINTAFEWMVDSVYKEKHPLAGKIKDVAAAAVLVVAIATAIVGVIIFYPYFKLTFAS
jgi:diacylglycerol kinase (ATP)